jgi:hypothetical protein
MLIVSNAPFKTGSTWLERIVRQMVDSKPETRPIPDRFRNTEWVHRSVRAELFEQFLREVDVAKHDYLSQNHTRDPNARKVLLADDRVRVLNMTRDIRDVLVSAYFHDQRHGRAKGEIADYWQKLGRRRVQQVLEHHRLWNTGHSQVFVTSYEALQTSFTSQIEALAAFIGLDDVDPEQLAEATSFSSMRRPGPKPHQRKGIVGDWRNHLSPEILDELAEIVASPSAAPPATDSAAAPASEPVTS